MQVDMRKGLQRISQRTVRSMIPANGIRERFSIRTVLLPCTTSARMEAQCSDRTGQPSFQGIDGLYSAFFTPNDP